MTQIQSGVGEVYPQRMGTHPEQGKPQLPPILLPTLMIANTTFLL